MVRNLWAENLPGTTMFKGTKKLRKIKAESKAWVQQQGFITSQ